MNKAIAALVFISLLALLIAGCKETTTPTLNETGGQETSNKAAAETGITGAINDVDNMDSELNDPELNNTDDYLDEVNW